MARHASPTALTRTAKRGAVAATALAATAALTIATPGAANAANVIPPGVPGAGTINSILTLAPLAPGTIPFVAIPVVAPQLDQLATVWSSIPGLGTLIPVANASGPIASTPLAPGWTGVGMQDTFSVAAPFGLGGISNTTYGIIGASPALGFLGSIGGNATTLTGPLGSALGINASLAGVTDPTSGNVTFTPTLGIGAVAPLGLGSALFSFSPGAITYGDGVFLITGPAFGTTLNFLGVETTLGLTTGQFGFDNGNLVFTGPTAGGTFDSPFIDADFDLATGGGSAGLGGVAVTMPSGSGSVDTPLGGGSVGVTPGTASAGLGGVTVDGPVVDASFDTPVGVDGTVNVDTGGASAGLGGVTVDGPSGSATVNTPVGNGTVEGDTGSASADLSGVDVTAPSGSAGVDNVLGDNGANVGAQGGTWHAGTDGVSVGAGADTPTSNDGIGGNVDFEAGPVESDNSVYGNGEVTTDPSVTVGADIDSTTSVDGDTVVDVDTSPSVTLP